MVVIQHTWANLSLDTPQNEGNEWFRKKMGKVSHPMSPKYRSELSMCNQSCWTQIHARIRGVIVCAALLCPALAPGTARAQSTVRSSGEWYAEVLKDRFPSGVPIHGWTHALDELPVHRDITRFDFLAQQTRLAGVDALRIDGSISLGALVDPFEVPLTNRSGRNCFSCGS